MFQAFATLIGWIDAALKWWHDQQQRDQGRVQEVAHHEDVVKADVAVADTVRSDVAQQLHADPAAIRAPDEFERPD